MSNISRNMLIAAPGCGKSYLTDKYPEIFADMDEIRLRCKYDIPADISREELEISKGNRNFKEKKYTIDELYSLYDICLNQGKILLAAPHGESFNYFEKRNIKFCFVYPKKELKKEMLDRFNKRKNSQNFIDETINKFDEFYESNKKDTRAAVHYETSKSEYLEEIVKKFGLKI